MESIAQNLHVLAVSSDRSESTPTVIANEAGDSQQHRPHAPVAARLLSREENIGKARSFDGTISTIQGRTNRKRLRRGGSREK